MVDSVCKYPFMCQNCFDESLNLNIDFLTYVIFSNYITVSEFGKKTNWFFFPFFFCFFLFFLFSFFLVLAVCQAPGILTGVGAFSPDPVEQV